jgi:hypothetical protein
MDSREWDTMRGQFGEAYEDFVFGGARRLNRGRRGCGKLLLKLDSTHCFAPQGYAENLG